MKIAKQILKLLKTWSFYIFLCTAYLVLKMNYIKVVGFAACFSSSDWFQPIAYVGQANTHNLKKSAELSGLL